MSASTIRVFVTFSIVNLVFPPFPATLPMALDKWSPFRGFTAKTDNTREQFNNTEGLDILAHFAASREKTGSKMWIVLEQTESTTVE